MDLAVTVNFKISEFHLHVHNNIQIQLTRLTTCSTNDGENKDGDHSWTLVDEHFSSSATLTKTETARGPTRTAMASNITARTASAS